MIKKLEAIKAECEGLLDVAECAGPAEAGWRITIDRINELLPFVEICIERGIGGEWIDRANKLISNWEYRY